VLGVTLAIAPNFSHFLNVPHFDAMYNRKRQLKCLKELQEAGLSAVPHLSARTEGDWQFWKKILDQNPGIYFVAKEFETGNKDPDEGRIAIRELARLQESTGRALHPILIGAAQFIADLPVFFDTLTVIDSTPFIKAMFRKGFDDTLADGSWYDSFSLERQAIDGLLTKNLTSYSAWLERLVAATKFKVGVRRAFHSTQPASVPETDSHVAEYATSTKDSSDVALTPRGVHGGVFFPQEIDLAGGEVSEGLHRPTV
jgi:Domain of unknown function (DUF4417)